MLVKWRAYDPNLRPRRTRLDVPGWAGTQDRREDGAREQPWHCIPFSEAARGGIELCFPHATEVRVTLGPDGLAAFDPPAFSDRPAAGRPEAPPPDPSHGAGSAPAGAAPDHDAAGAGPPPFRSFGPPYYTYQSCLDLKVDPAWAIKVETHPRFYTDPDGHVPIAVPALLRHWWPMIFFLVFKTPRAGETHVFRPGEPFAQISVVPADEKPELAEMPIAEAAEREMQSRRIYASRSTLSADTEWTSSTNTVFDGTYRRIAGAARSTRRD